MYIRTSFVCSTLRVSSIRIFILIQSNIQQECLWNLGFGYAISIGIKNKITKTFLAEDYIAQKVLESNKIYLVHDMCMYALMYNT